MARRSNKKERLLDAAAEAFWIDGFAGTSLADIADRSGVPLGNIYYYFKTKSAIALGVADIYIEETIASLELIDQKTGSSGQKLDAFFEMLKESIASRTSHGCPLANSIRDFSGVATQAHARTNEVFNILIAWLAKTLSEGGDKNAMQHARNAIGTWQGGIVLSHAANDESILMETLAQLETNLKRSLRVSENTHSDST